MRFLITGGAGFIGSHLAEELLRREGDSRIRVLDNLSSGKESNLQSIPGAGRIELIRGDIREPEQVRAAMRDVSIVFHHAALTSVAGSVRDPAACNEVNVTGTLNVLLAARDAGVRKLLFASSSAVYGENPVSPKSEALPPEPLSPYAASKLGGEIYCQVFARLYSLSTVCFRYFNVFGPRQDPNSQYAAVIPKFMDAIVCGRSPRVYGDGGQTRDFIYVKDIVQANLRAAFQEVPPGSIFNVGTGTSLSLNQLLGELRGLTGKDPRPEYLDPVPGDIRHSLADISRLAGALGFEPAFTIQQGLRATYEFFTTGRG